MPLVNPFSPVSDIFLSETQKKANHHKKPDDGLLFFNMLDPTTADTSNISDTLQTVGQVTNAIGALLIVGGAVTAQPEIIEAGVAAEGFGTGVGAVGGILSGGQKLASGDTSGAKDIVNSINQLRDLEIQEISNETIIKKENRTQTELLKDTVGAISHLADAYKRQQGATNRGIAKENLTLTGIQSLVQQEEVALNQIISQGRQQIFEEEKLEDKIEQLEDDIDKPQNSIDLVNDIKDFNNLEGAKEYLAEHYQLYKSLTYIEQRVILLELRKLM